MPKKGKKKMKSKASKSSAMSFSPYSSSASAGAAPFASHAQTMSRKQPMANNAQNVQQKRGVDSSKRSRKEKEKRIKKGRDYFFVMRKMVCFLMFLLFTICIALFAVGYINLVPEFSSLYVEPDYTPLEERTIEDEETGEIIEKPDMSVHFTTVDPIFGFIKKITGKDIAPSPKYDKMAEMVEVGVSDMISSLAMTYYPIAMVLFIIIALISMIKAFLAMFGKRVFRLFGLSSFWMIVFAFVVVIAGVASNMPTDVNLDFTQIVPFLMSALTRPLDGPTTAAGIGLLAMLILPVITLILSMFSKKKIPYSIFD